MHPAVLEYLKQFATDEPVAVLDVGGRDVNGTARHLFPNADPYDVLDLRPGPNVNIVADAAEWSPSRDYDLVLCTEVCEHAAAWPAVLRTAFRALRLGGEIVLTCAGPGREPHSGTEKDGPPAAGEYYGNVDPGELRYALYYCGFDRIDVQQVGGDVQGTAIK